MKTETSEVEPSAAPDAPTRAAHHSRAKAAERAFVVQFDPISGGRGRLRGRAEVVASGETMHFRSLKQLVEFMVGILRSRSGPGGPP